MAGIQEHYGMLDANGKPTARAIAIFLQHRDDILKQGKVNLPFPCVEGGKNDTAAAIDISDKEKYKSFYDNWVYGIYANCLKMLNLQGNIALPIFDALAMGAKLNIPNAPKMDLPTLLGFIAAGPACPQLSLLSLNIDLVKIPDYLPKIKDLIKVPMPPIPKIPAIPSPSFPTLGFPVPVLNLKDRQIAIYTALPKVVLNIIGKIANPNFLINFATKGPNALFALGCQAMMETMPKPSIENPITATANFGAVVASLAKPAAVTALGLVIGSADPGIVSGLRKKETGEPDEKPVGDSIAVYGPIGGRKESSADVTTPAFRRRLFDIFTKEIPNYPSSQGGGMKINPDWVNAIILSETAGSFNPAIQAYQGEKRFQPQSTWKDRPFPPNLGLMQFSFQFFGLLNEYPIISDLKSKYPDFTASRITYDVAGHMTQVQQLEIVKYWFIANAKVVNNFAHTQGYSTSTFCADHVWDATDVYVYATAPLGLYYTTSRNGFLYDARRYTDEKRKAEELSYVRGNKDFMHYTTLHFNSEDQAIHRDALKQQLNTIFETQNGRRILCDSSTPV
jgi:hypothetical protein